MFGFSELWILHPRSWELLHLKWSLDVGQCIPNVVSLEKFIYVGDVQMLGIAKCSQKREICLIIITFNCLVYFLEKNSGWRKDKSLVVKISLKKPFLSPSGVIGMQFTAKTWGGRLSKWASARCALSIRGQACLARRWRMSISLSPEGVEGLFRRLILQGVSPLQSAAAAINAGGHIWLQDSRGSSCHTPHSESVCVCLAVCFTHTAIEACKYSSQLSPPAPVWQGLQAFRSRLREEALSEYRCCQRRAQ